MTHSQGINDLKFGVNLLRADKRDIELHCETFSIGEVEETYVKKFVAILLSEEQTKISQENATNTASMACNYNDEEKDFRNILTCRVCQELFDTPVTLVCGHTFCIKCLASRCKQPELVSCPTCTFSCKQGYSSNLAIRELVRGNFEEDILLRERTNAAEKILNEGNLKEAMNQIEGLLERYPNNINLVCLRSKAFLHLDCSDKALNELETACKLNPFESKAFFTRGEVLFSVGSYEEAVLMFLRASALKPEYTVYREKLLICLQKVFEKISSAYNNPCVEKKAGLKPADCSTPTCTAKTQLPIDGNAEAQLKTEATKTNHDPTRMTMNELECKLCYNMIYKPVTTPCGHTYCQSCLSRCLDHRFQCPCCRRNLEGYLELVTKGHQGVCETLEKILQLKFEKEYNARRLTYENELENVVKCDKNVTEIPIFVCTLAVPNIACPLHIFEPKYKLMIRRCIESGSNQFGMCLPDTEHEFAQVGTMLEISSVKFLPDGRSIIQTIGGKRFKVLDKRTHDGYYMAKVEWLTDKHSEYMDNTELVCEVYNLMVLWFLNLTSKHQLGVVEALGDMPNKDDSTPTNSFKWFWWLLAAIPLNTEAKLIILSMTSVTERLVSAKRFLELLLKQQGLRNS